MRHKGEEKKRFPSVPENVPRTGGPISRVVGQTLLRWMGWRIEGELPNIKKLVVAAAPHTSNWDFIIVMLVRLAIGVRFSYLMKREAFFWPFKGLFMSMGGIPINRKQSGDIVAQMMNWYADHEKVWLAITPEGTRSKVDKWKTGFLRIAEVTQVPILLVNWDYPSKTLHINKIIETSGHYEQDALELQKYVNESFTGRHPETQ